MSFYNKTAVLQKPGKCLRPDHITLRMRKAPSLTRSGMLPKEDAHREWLQQIQQSFQRSGLKRRVARHELVDLADTHVDQNASLRLYGYAECLMYTLNVNVKSPGVWKDADVGLRWISGKADVLHSGRPTRWIAPHKRSARRQVKFSEHCCIKVKSQPHHLQIDTFSWNQHIDIYEAEWRHLAVFVAARQYWFLITNNK